MSCTVLHNDRRCSHLTTVGVHGDECGSHPETSDHCDAPQHRGHRLVEHVYDARHVESTRGPETWTSGRLSEGYQQSSQGSSICRGRLEEGEGGERRTHTTWRESCCEVRARESR